MWAGNLFFFFFFYKITTHLCLGCFQVPDVETCGPSGALWFDSMKSLKVLLLLSSTLLQTDSRHPVVIKSPGAEGVC